MKDVCIIVTTIREFQCMKEYYANARENGFDLNRTHTLLITEDFCDKSAMKKMLDEEGVSGEVFNQTDRDKWMEETGLAGHKGIIPRKSHAETSFGLLYMWAHREYEYGVFIDDDTLPVKGHDFFGGHLKNLAFKGKIDHAGSNKNWVNVLYQNFERHKLYPRGYPYSAMQERVTVGKHEASEVVCSQGLWTNVPDLDAVRILIDGDLDGRAKTRTVEEDFKGNFVAAKGSYLTVCSMNLAFKREVIPCFYQLPMDDNPWKIGRFDDIWSGVFLKKACDLLGKSIITGYPLCQHNKAPRSTFKDLNAEVPALGLNEHLWEVLESRQLKAKDYFEAYAEFASLLESSKPKYAGVEFFHYTAKKMKSWLECLEMLGR